MKIAVQSSKLGRSGSIDPNGLITFEEGILGFPAIKHYFLLGDEKDHPFLWLQAAEDPDLGFVVVDPLVMNPDYHPLFPETDLQWLEITGPESMAILSIVTIPRDNPLRLSANLMAPLLINHRRRKGKQIVLNESGFNIREPIIKQLVNTQKTVSNP